MAKRKMSAKQRRYFGARKSRRSYSRSSGGNAVSIKTLAPAAAYGAIRGKFASVVLPIAQPIFGAAGAYADELAN